MFIREHVKIRCDISVRNRQDYGNQTRVREIRPMATSSYMVHTYTYTVKEVKWSHYRPGVAQRVGRGIALLFHDRGTRRGWVVSSTSWQHFTPGERPGTHFTGGWVGPRAGLEELKISSLPVQPVVSRYTDWATWPTHILYILLLLLLFDMDVSCHRPFLPGTSLEPAVIPTSHASSFTLQYFLYYVWCSKYSCLL